LEGFVIGTTLDLAQGFHQTQIAAGHKWKTAFKTQYGMYEWKVMPFGLKNAPSSFQSLMNSIFRDIMGVFVLVYIDDIFVFSKRVEDHPGHVKEVLRRLREHKLIAKLRKCKFHQTKLDWVGLVISNKGIETDQEKVTAAMNWKAPKNVKQVQEFLGFVNFY
jgi:hypothetical protein